MKSIVCKFGGTSLADSKAFEQVKKIIKSNNLRKFVVVSAPGKIDENSAKVTDLLIQSYEKSKNNLYFGLHFYQIKKRFYDIINSLNIDIDLDKDFEELYSKIEEHNDYDYVISRGEQICAKIMAKFLDYDFIDAKDIIIFDKDGKVDINESKREFLSKTNINRKYVIPGFYGSQFGKIKTFTRGGSDITGAIIACLSQSDLYENFTDVDGVFDIDPKKNSNAKLIKEMTYSQMKALYEAGAQVLHGDSLEFLKQNNIVLNLRNTFNYSNSGTLIIPD